MLNIPRDENKRNLQFEKGKTQKTSSEISRGVEYHLSGVSLEIQHLFSDRPDEPMFGTKDSVLNQFHPIFILFGITNHNNEAISGWVDGFWRDAKDGRQSVASRWDVNDIAPGSQRMGIVVLPGLIGSGPVTLQWHQTNPSVKQDPEATASSTFSVGQDFTLELRSFHIYKTAAPFRDTLRAWVSVQDPGKVKWVPPPHETPEQAEARIKSGHKDRPKGYYEVIIPSKILELVLKTIGDRSDGDSETLNLSVPVRYEPSGMSTLILSSWIANDGGQKLVTQEDVKTFMDNLSSMASVVAGAYLPTGVGFFLNWWTQNFFDVLIAALFSNCDRPVFGRDLQMTDLELRKLIDQNIKELKIKPGPDLDALQSSGGQFQLNDLLDLMHKLDPQFPCRNPSYSVDVVLAQQVHIVDIQPCLAQMKPGRPQIFTVGMVRDNDNIANLSSLDLDHIRWTTSEDIQYQDENGQDHYVTFGTFRKISACKVEYTPPQVDWPEPFIRICANLNVNGVMKTGIAIVEKSDLQANDDTTNNSSTDTIH